MKIFLIGMPGSGKTTLGKELASRLMVDFIDLDVEIENTEQKAISDIFRERGEEYFRLVEARLLREFAAGRPAFVMATGGGAPCFHHGMEIINDNGISVFLDFPVSVLVERVRQNRDRPLLLASDEKQLRERLERIRAARLECYKKATISLENPTVEEVLKSLHART